MDTPKSEKSVSIRFPVDLFDAIHQIAAEDERSFNAEVVWALRTYLAQRDRQRRKERRREGKES